ncbi:MAG: alpha-amylase family glycosyl hydrolase [Candidatus Zixiibacteriota bacterium]
MLADRAELQKLLRSYTHFGFHLSRKSWDWLAVSSVLTTEPETTQANELFRLRQLADRFNERCSQTPHVPAPLHAGQLSSLNVIVDVFRYIIELYSREEQPGVIGRGMDWTGRQKGSAIITQPPPAFVRLFPPSSVLDKKQSEAGFLRDAFGVTSTRDMIVREMILLHLDMANPAFRPFRALFDDADLRAESPNVTLIQALESFFATQPPFGPTGMTLFECLYAPIRAYPDSLEGQLDFIRRHWAHFLPMELLERVLLAVDILEEERLMRGFGPGQIEALRFDRDQYGYDLGYSEPAAFSRDADWMSNVVLIAKTVYVWLFQLSKKYQRDIRLLSDVPDEELDQLARWGFTGLWLIGIWERSPASQKIKQIMGNPEAAASAYSLYDYIIAGDLGGETAFENLKHRAWQRGIRLASDMVPNHVGIYSRWVIQHPHWFVQQGHPPFPVYQYTGVDLSLDQRVCLQIEDGYWQHRDAAVVFKRIDKWTGDVRYIYHGNDGTSTPWNDTAQLNYLLPEVREAVIQTILHVARQFPIIRFDAAMTLAKKHYQRLWFPQPGDGGAIPSRAEHGMTRQQFDLQMPKEFWREVVDRIAQELPETLLLAEAFWLMEGYFVRTLGMHRVYNSAFMNMLKMEENAKYRTTVKNVLEFSPEVLKRFVNFMNNPDERTAVDQFGKEDKYYGVAVMLVTMPGLPMFGHGQIEGFTEKYGMEYRRSYWDEQVDWHMVRRHEAQIFPLMRRRHLFSGAANFAFYDFNTPDGWVDENVFAYSNRSGDERAIILYNNAYNSTRGRLQTSTPINIGEGETTNLVRRTLAEALALNSSDGCYYVFRDYQCGLEYIRSGRQIADEGLWAELHAYQCHAFLDFREIHDADGSWAHLAYRLSGAGVPNIEEAHRELRLEPVLKPYREVMNAVALRELSGGDLPARSRFVTALEDFLSAALSFSGVSAGRSSHTPRLTAEMEELFGPGQARQGKRATGPKKASQVQGVQTVLRHVLIAWLTIRHLDVLQSQADSSPAEMFVSRLIEEWRLLNVVQRAFEGLLADDHAAYVDRTLVQIIVAHRDLLESPSGSLMADRLERTLVDPVVREYLLVNRYQDVLWLNKERLELLVEALQWVTRVEALETVSSAGLAAQYARRSGRILLDAAERSGYQIEKMTQMLTGARP